MAQMLNSINPSVNTPGHTELQQAQGRRRSLYGATAGFSIFVNLLMLTEPLYTLQVYDGALSSRSVATLLVLAALITGLYMITGIRDCCRTRRMARIGAGFQQALERRGFNAVIGPSSPPDNEKGSTGLRDLDAIQRWMSPPALIALFDLPWTPLFLAGIWILRPLLGSFDLLVVAILIALALLNQGSSRTVLDEAYRGLDQANRLSDKIRTKARMVQSMGMHQASYTLWQAQRRRALLTQLVAVDPPDTFGAVTTPLACSCNLPFWGWVPILSCRIPCPPAS